MRIHVARQPIFNRKLGVYGYELLYRQTDMHNAFGDAKEDEASSHVITNSFLSIGIDKLTGGRKAFVNFTANLLDQEVATLFPRETLVIEILENVAPEPEIIEKSRLLKSMGYKIALDDFIFSAEYIPLIEIADIIKIDLLQTPMDTARSIIQRFNRTNLEFLAEKIEDQAAYELAKEAGFAYFQGYFFSKPTIISQNDVHPLVHNYLRLIQETNEPHMEFGRIARIIKQDVSLSYKLLRLVNSVAFGFRYRIENIHHALVALGEGEVRKWVSLISLMGINSDKPDELIRLSLVRAKFSENLARISHLRCNPDDMFMMGMFSLIDVIMSRPIEEVISKVVLSPSVKEALIERSGALAPYYELMVNYEMGNWENVAQIASEVVSSNPAVAQSALSESYLEGLNWCSSIFGKSRA